MGLQAWQGWSRSHNRDVSVACSRHVIMEPPHNHALLSVLCLQKSKVGILIHHGVVHTKIGSVVDDMSFAKARQVCHTDVNVKWLHIAK